MSAKKTTKLLILAQARIRVKCLSPPCIILTLFLSRSRAVLGQGKLSATCASKQNTSSCGTAVLHGLQGCAASRWFAAVREVSLR